jgi:hypothetical protein
MFGIAGALIAVNPALRSWSTERLETTPIGRRVTDLEEQSHGF